MANHYPMLTVQVLILIVNGHTCSTVDFPLVWVLLSLDPIIDVSHCIAAKYSPVRNDMVRTCIVVTGREGVWRLQNFDLGSSDSEIEEKMASDFPPMQPEFANEFVLVELTVGKDKFYKHQ